MMVSQDTWQGCHAWPRRLCPAQLRSIIHRVINVTPGVAQWTACTNTCGHSEALGLAKPITGSHMEMPGLCWGAIYKLCLGVGVEDQESGKLAKVMGDRSAETFAGAMQPVLLDGFLHAQTCTR